MGVSAKSKPPPAQAEETLTGEKEVSPDSADDKLVGNPVNMLFLNIPSISGGLDIWKWSKSKMGTTGPRDLLKARQDFGDGKLECITYRAGAGFVMEQLRAPMTLSGRGHRVYSGGGPLRLTFKSPDDPEYIKATKHCKGRLYMEVDGEFFIVHQPQSVIIRHHMTINVLCNTLPLPGACQC